MKIQVLVQQPNLIGMLELQIQKLKKMLNKLNTLYKVADMQKIWREYQQRNKFHDRPEY